MKRRFLCVFLFVLFLGIISRWVVLNRDVDKSKLKIVSMDETVETNGLQITLKDTDVYEMPAFVEQYPETESFYAIDTNTYVKMGLEEGYRTLKYVVSATLEFTNISDDLREIVYSDYQLTCENQSVLQGVDPEMIKILNGDQIEYQLKSAETISVLLCYDLYGITIKDLSYDKIKKLKLVLPVSGYPDIRAFALKTDSLICSSGTFDPYKRQDADELPVMNEKIPEDSVAGTVLDLGGEIVQNGVGMQVESVQIVKNLTELTEYDPDAWLSYYKDSFIHEDGTFETIAELDRGLPDDYYESGYTDYAVFIKLKMHNYTNATQNVYNGFGLYNSDHSLEGPVNAEYTATNDVSEKEEDYYKGSIKAGENIETILGYTRSIKDTVDVNELPLYISNDGDTRTEEFNLDAGKGGFGVYLRVQ